VTDADWVGVLTNLARALVPGDELHSSATLRFRTEPELRASLHRAGFAVDRIFGGCGREPVGAGDGELLVVARRDEKRAVDPRPTQTRLQGSDDPA